MTHTDLAPNPYDPPTLPTLHPVDPYGPEYDPGAYGEPDLEATAVIPLQAEPVDPLAAPDVADGWATGQQEAWHEAGWGERGWERPDYDDADYDATDDATPYEDEFDELDPEPPVDQRPAPRRARLAALLVPVVVGIAVSVGLGVYARLHEGTGTAINIAGFSSGLAAKTWLTTAAFVLVLVQLWSSMRMYGRLSRRGPAGPRVAAVHRWSGRIAVLLTIPVAVHCLYALGYEDSSLRVLLHSLAGCFFYGAFTAKMLVLPKRDAPRWALPVLGGLVFVLLTGLFLTSSVWFFSTKGLTF
jgi:hypothetical protein